MCVVDRAGEITGCKEILDLPCDCRSHRAPIGLKETCWESVRSRSLIRMYSKETALHFWGGGDWCELSVCRRGYTQSKRLVYNFSSWRGGGVEDLLVVVNYHLSYLLVFKDWISIWALDGYQSVMSSSVLCRSMKESGVLVSKSQAELTVSLLPELFFISVSFKQFLIYWGDQEILRLFIWHCLI